ncbi:TonB-dependent receptor plug domain-containing protein [Chromobacterium phragmitis]|uniref:TonB-dependent receptor plug domain-containing protein n=1 Tax=Chromobacterium phragmitis TaxID=2202141 RepID=UPI001F216007|nr:TonB-dependent receptor plug domain-containing protein [Chromobacterium phragmitis]
MNHKRKTLAIALSLMGGIGYAQMAHADDTDSSALQRVDVIGSHIKRLKSEKATEVTTVKVEDLTKQGLSTVEQVVNALAANQSNIGATSSVGASTGGAAFANLRGLGRQYTLVLLDGRRVSLHPFDGYAGRPECHSAYRNRARRRSAGRARLRFTASDAIGGVINFITKKTSQGLSLGGDFLTPQRSGGNEKNLNISYGYGNLGKDGFNIYADASYHKTDKIMASQRDFASAITAASKPSSNSYPGNYDVDLRDQPISPSSAYPNCPAPTVAKGGVCKTYPSTMIGIQPEVETWSGFAKATMRLGENHDLSISYNITRNKNMTIAAPTPTGGDVMLPSGTQGIVTPTGGATLTPFLRTMPLGNRLTQAVNVQQKLQFNLEGQLAGWDYRTGAGYAQTYATEELVSGFTGVNEVRNAYLNNQISLVTGLATDPNVWNQIGIRGHLDDGTYNIASADFSMSKEVMALPAGPLAVAFGGEARHEYLEHNFNYSISKDALGPACCSH